MSGFFTRLLLAAGFVALTGTALWAQLPPLEVALDALPATRRQEIKSHDIFDRPQRVGHFYGNTVRRRFYRQSGG